MGLEGSSDCSTSPGYDAQLSQIRYSSSDFSSLCLTMSVMGSGHLNGNSMAQMCERL